MLPEYEYDFPTDVTKLRHVLSIYNRYIEHLSVINFKMLNSWPNLFSLAFKRNQSDFNMQLFLLKIAI